MKMAEPTTDVTNGEEEEDDEDHEQFEISLRDITEIENNALSEKHVPQYNCNHSNVHIWKLENDMPNSCHLFSNLNTTVVALGGEHMLLLTRDKNVYCCGSNDYGQLGLGDTEPREGIHLIESLENLEVINIVCGARHSAAVTKNGLVYCWGDSRQGQCGIKSKDVFTTPTQVTFAPPRKITELKINENVKTVIKTIDCGELFTAALDSRGMIWTWGTGYGLGHGDQYDKCITPKLVIAISHRKAIQLVCGAFHCLAVLEDDFKNTEIGASIPDLRTSSVSSAYYSELKIANSSSASKVQFLQTNFYTSGDEEENEDITKDKRCRSDTELSNQQIFMNTKTVELQGNSSSEINLQEKALDKQQLYLTGLSSYHSETVALLNETSDESVISSPDHQSIVSSEYHSAVDIPSKVVNRESSSLTATDVTPKNIFQNKDKIRAIDCVASSPFQTIDAPEDIFSKNDIFTGRKSMFEEFSADEIKSVGLSSDSLAEPTTFETKKLDLVHFRSTSDYSTDSFFECPLSTEVWSWGKCNYGQLGHADTQDRYDPARIEKLSKKSIAQVTAGAYHSLAVSVQGQVYSWGDNTFGQLAHPNTLVLKPKKVKVLSVMRIWDIAAGRNFSLFLSDSDRTKTNVYFCGEVNGPRCKHTVSSPVIDISSSNFMRRESRWSRLSRRSRRSLEGYVSPSFVGIQVRKLLHFSEHELVRCLHANGYTFAAITELDCRGSEFEAIYKFAVTERLFYQQLKIIQKAIIEPLIKTDAWLNITKSIGGESVIPLIDSFIDLLNGICREIIHVTDFIRCSLPNKDLFGYLFADSFRGLYDRYSKSYADALAVGVLQQCNKPASNIIGKNKDIVNDLEQHLALLNATFESLLKVPLMRSYVYCDIAKRLTPHFKNRTECDQLKEVISRWTSFSDASTQRLISAGVTNKFWNECHAKLAEALKDPQRRILKSSKVDPLNLMRASRLSSHSYILCNDVFVHVQFNRNFQVFPLVTLWADSVEDSNDTNNAIKITSPEESFVLAAGTPNGKIAWLTEVNTAVAQCLNASSSLSLDVSAVNQSSGLLKAAVAREAQYQYVNHLKYRTATYKGMWLSGLPHGRGRMSWPDRCSYEGEFVNGYFHGFAHTLLEFTCSKSTTEASEQYVNHGQMVWPGENNSPYDKIYDGEWVQGVITGYGRMRYPNGEDYVGHFKDGFRHGHGTLKSSQNKTTLDTVYVGNWENDIKTGYGVLDYIVRGEKYMGMWQNDQRNGEGVVVTVDGVYYEGKFVQNKLAGKGILLSEDDTCYEGEFTADMLLSGKGILTQPNGDFIDGTFYGYWGEGIKVNGVFSKFTNQLKQTFNAENARNTLLRTNDFTIHADLKWHSLFDECYAKLGCAANSTSNEPEDAWRQVIETLIKSSCAISRHSCVAFDLCTLKKVNYKERMELAHNLKGLQEYLTEAFDTKGHPLHILVEGLIEVYRATYVGVGAHRRLLPHAVAEAKSYVSRLFNVLRVLFPDLHDEDFVLLSNETVDGIAEMPVNSMSLLHPLLLPRLYPPLFTLYALQTEKTDALYMEKLYYLNKRGDIALMSFLGIKRKFWLIDRHEPSDGEKVARSEKKAYLPAIETLERISTSYSPMGKIEIIRRTFAKIHEEIDDHFEGARQVLAMDDLFPLFQYIVIRARVPHLGSEINFIEDMVDDSMLVGESGHMVTTLSACYFQIQNERDRD